MRNPMPNADSLLRILPLLALSGLAACGLNPFSEDDAAASTVMEPARAQAAQPAVTVAPRPAPAGASQPVYRSQPPSSPPVRLRANHPDRHVVVRGDTLWDISARFLEDPWLWPEIWQVNPQIQNPHLIYPGDVISLVYVDGRPQLRVERGAPAGLRTERLSPEIRVEPLDQAIDTIPYDLIRPFIARPTILEKGEAEELPYVLSIKEHLLAGANFEVYVRGDGIAEGSRYGVVHVGKKLRDPDNGDTLGYEANYVGEGQIVRGGDPSTLFLRSTEREVLRGDRLMPAGLRPRLDFVPRAPDQPVEGSIISVVDGVALVGQFQVVALNRGQRHGLQPGHLLEVLQVGEKVRDPYRGGVLGGVLGSKVRLPEEPAGELMVFRTYDRMSYGLVLRATSEMRVGDKVRNH